MVYDTPITEDVIGYLDDSEVEVTLRKISALPADPEAFCRAGQRREDAWKSLRETSEKWRAERDGR